MMKTVTTLISMLFAVMYAGVCAAEDVSVLDDAILDYSNQHYSSQFPSTVTAKRVSTDDGKYQIILDSAEHDYTRVQIDGLEEADFAAFEDVPDDLRVHD